MFDHQLPINPGLSLGGVELHSPFSAIHSWGFTELLPPGAAAYRDPWYLSADESFIAIVNRKTLTIRALYATQKYSGEVLGRISTKLTYGEAIKLRPSLILDQEASFYDTECPGYFLKDYENDLELEEIVARQITWIGVFDPADRDYSMNSLSLSMDSL